MRTERRRFIARAVGTMAAMGTAAGVDAPNVIAQPKMTRAPGQGEGGSLRECKVIAAIYARLTATRSISGGRGSGFLSRRLNRLPTPTSFSGARSARA